MHLISFKFSNDSNPIMSTDFVSTTRKTKDILDSSFLCSKVSEHLTITGISEVLLAF